MSCWSYPTAKNTTGDKPNKVLFCSVRTSDESAHPACYPAALMNLTCSAGCRAAGLSFFLTNFVHTVEKRWEWQEQLKDWCSVSISAYLQDQSVSENITSLFLLGYCSLRQQRNYFHNTWPWNRDAITYFFYMWNYQYNTSLVHPRRWSVKKRNVVSRF